jgi:hypothetical protein
MISCRSTSADAGKFSSMEKGLPRNGMDAEAEERPSGRTTGSFHQEEIPGRMKSLIMR